MSIFVGLFGPRNLEWIARQRGLAQAPSVGVPMPDTIHQSCALCLSRCAEPMNCSLVMGADGSSPFGNWWANKLSATFARQGPGTGHGTGNRLMRLIFEEHK